MKEIRVSIKAVLLLAVVAVSLGAASARADTYSWDNLQSDIAGVAVRGDDLGGQQRYQDFDAV
jgi:hypothetical protein